MDAQAERQELAGLVARRYLATQLRVIREQRELNLEQLAERSGISADMIARLEDPSADIGDLEVPTLQQLAFALGLRLKITFENFASLPEMVQELLTPRQLQRPAFEEEFGPQSAG